MISKKDLSLDRPNARQIYDKSGTGSFIRAPHAASRAEIDKKVYNFHLLNVWPSGPVTGCCWPKRRQRRAFSDPYSFPRDLKSREGARGAHKQAVRALLFLNHARSLPFLNCAYRIWV